MTETKISWVAYDGSVHGGEPLDPHPDAIWLLSQFDVYDSWWRSIGFFRSWKAAVDYARTNNIPLIRGAIAELRYL